MKCRLLFVVLSFCFPVLPSAAAQDPSEAGAAGPEVSSTDFQELPEVESAKAPSLQYRTPATNSSESRGRLAGPRAGVALSTILAAGGIATIWSGAAIMSWESSCWLGDPDCGAEAGPTGKMLVGVGVVASVGGLVGIAVSAKRLKREKNHAATPSPRRLRASHWLLAGIERTP